MAPALLDQLAHRYGKWPHEVLDLTPGELTVAIACYRGGFDEASRAKMVFITRAV